MENRHLRTGSPTRERDVVARRLTWMAIAVGAVILVLGMVEEPYHIDELRQVQSYSRSVGGLIDASFAQEQPPLDPFIGKVVQHLVGTGHVQQRLHPTLLGILSLALLALLMWRAGLRMAVPAAVLIYSIVPVVVSVTAYARQYALPVFLALLFLNGADWWLRARSRLGLTVAWLAALALPLSRAVDPMIFLVGVAGTLVVWGLRDGTASWPGSVIFVQTVVMGSLVVVGIPVSLRLRDEASEFIAPATGLGDRLYRVATDLPSTLVDNNWVGVLALIVLGFALASRRVRRFAAGEWWLWPLIAIPIGFAGAFFLLARVDQPFFWRYAYSWWLPFAVICGVLLEGALEAAEGRSIQSIAAIVAVSGLTIALLVALVDDLRSDAWIDYEPLAGLIEEELASGDVVYFDNVVEIGRYRAGFADYGRFAPPERMIWATAPIIHDPDGTPTGTPFAVALYGNDVDVAGWQRIEASTAMNLYVPQSSVSGRLDAGETLIAFGRAFEPEKGAMLRLAGASLLASIGEPEKACREAETLMEEVPEHRDDIVEALEGSPLAGAIGTCAP